ncbi:MAG: S1 RNA-binding domain-containing protein [Anaerolineae bacterium]|jgi:small subunit ribosomal protein S1
MNKETLPTNQDANDQEEASSTMMEQLEEYLTEGEYDYQLPKRGDIHTGVVVEIGDRGAIVDAGFKRDGIVPAGDLDRLDEETRKSIQPGDEVAVAVRKPQDQEGRLILSIYQALVQEDWQEAEKMLEDGNIYEGEISGYNRGGLLVPFGRIRGFIPASHTVGMPRGLKGEERRDRLADMVGEKVGLKVIEVDRHRRRLILSQRQARRAWQKIQRKRVMEELSEGKTVSGTVTGITDFGAFVDLGGADGLIHISELSWRQVDDPREVVEVGDEVEVYVLNLDWDRTRIALSLKRLKPNPWSQVADHYEVGELAEGRVSRVLDFGAFVQLDIGVEGLLHISEMTGASQLSPTDILQNGQRVLVKIIGIDTHKQRITLSARQVHRDQWEQWMAQHKIASGEVEEEAAKAVEVPEEPEEDVAATEPEAVVETTAFEDDTVGEPSEEEPITPEADVSEETAEPSEPEEEIELQAEAEAEAQAPEEEVSADLTVTESVAEPAEEEQEPEAEVQAPEEEVSTELTVTESVAEPAEEDREPEAEAEAEAQAPEEEVSADLTVTEAVTEPAEEEQEPEAEAQAPEEEVSADLTVTEAVTEPAEMDQEPESGAEAETEVPEDEDSPELTETEVVTEPTGEDRELQAETAADDVTKAEPEEIAN